MNDSRFVAGGAVVAVLAPLVTFVGVFVLPAPAAFRGSISASALVVLVFAADNLRSVRAAGEPAFPSATVAAVLGAWLAAAPLVYDAGFAPTALAQFAGLLTAAFGAHGALVAVES
ncbi:MAG: hypothetical protein ABEH47_08470 [Haloferacaceae archaeon]